MHTIEVTFKGHVTDLKLELEGKEIGLYNDGGSTWTRKLEMFPIEGKLDILLICKGFNGANWKLSIKVDDKGPKEYTGTIKKGHSVLNEQLSIPIS